MAGIEICTQEYHQDDAVLRQNLKSEICPREDHQDDAVLRQNLKSEIHYNS